MSARSDEHCNRPRWREIDHWDEFGDQSR
jgi:hypothetical protein